MNWGLLGFSMLYCHFWRRQWQLIPILLPGKSHAQRSLVGCSPWGPGESDMTEWLHFHALEKEMATHSSVLAWRTPGTGSLVGWPLWGRTESDTTEATQQQQQHCHFCVSYPGIFCQRAPQKLPIWSGAQSRRRLSNWPQMQGKHLCLGSRELGGPVWLEWSVTLLKAVWNPCQAPTRRSQKRPFLFGKVQKLV